MSNTQAKLDARRDKFRTALEKLWPVAKGSVTWINKGTLLGMMASLAELLEPCLEAVKASVCASHVVHADETVWRCGGPRRSATGI